MGSLLERYDRGIATLPSSWTRFAVQLELVHAERVAAVAALAAQSGFAVSSTDARSGALAFDVPSGGLEGLRPLLGQIERLEPRAEMAWSVEPAGG